MEEGTQRFVDEIANPVIDPDRVDIIGRRSGNRPTGPRVEQRAHPCGFYTKEMQTRLRAMRDLRREVKDLTQKLRGGVRSGKPPGAR